MADTGNSLLRRITPAGLVDTLAGGSAGVLKDGVGAKAMFDGPLAIAIGPTGALYISEASGEVRLIK